MTFSVPTWLLWFSGGIVAGIVITAVVIAGFLWLINNIEI